MLTLLNGPRSIHLRSISRSILDSQKTWNFKDYTVKYRDDGFIIFDSNQKNVYCNNSSLGQLNHDIIKYSKNEETVKNNISLIEEINDFSKKIDETIKNNHFVDSWPTIDQSFLLPLEYKDKLKKIEEYESEEKTYDDILNSYYNNSSVDDIWTGRFATPFIEKIRNDIGSENLSVINFVRNPSSCMFTNSFSHSGNIKILEQNNIQITNNIIEGLNAENSKLNDENLSILNSLIVSKLPGVINVRYEDFLKNGNFLLNDLNIPLPFFIKNHNNIISEYEFLIYNSESINEEKLNEFNEIFSNISAEYIVNLQPISDVIKFIIQYLNLKNEDEFKIQVIENITKTIPKNIFQELNYSPLTLEQIINK